MVQEFFYLKVKQLCSIGLCNRHKLVVSVQRPPNTFESCKGTQNKCEGGWKPAQTPTMHVRLSFSGLMRRCRHTLLFCAKLADSSASSRQPAQQKQDDVLKFLIHFCRPTHGKPKLATKQVSAAQHVAAEVCTFDTAPT